MRRIGVSQFRKTTLINIREFYEKDGKTLPGKKVIGIIPPLEVTINESFRASRSPSNNTWPWSSQSPVSTQLFANWASPSTTLRKRLPRQPSYQPESLRRTRQDPIKPTSMRRAMRMRVEDLEISTVSFSWRSGVYGVYGVSGFPSNEEMF